MKTRLQYTAWIPFALIAAFCVPAMATPTSATPDRGETEAFRMTARLGAPELPFVHGRAVYIEGGHRRSLTVQVEVGVELREVQLFVRDRAYSIRLDERGLGFLELRSVEGEGLPALKAGETLIVMVGGRELMSGELS